jgi:hypothetical protein
MPANGRNRHPRAISVAIAATLALATAGIAGAASNSVHVKITKKAISITGSRSATGDVVQLSYDPHKCASFAVESTRSTQFSDFRGTSAGSVQVHDRALGAPPLEAAPALRVRVPDRASRAARSCSSQLSQQQAVLTR